ncbi:MAG: Lrp/AsnC ligand binding domain-containing protein [Candidatus Methanomethyliaceae archaeon]|nr:Lrp/AsnC ligand binding domain-containing protein [Candidatus Methanomethyliaceae archaeon]MDD1766568.1 Lrp/AsnC ligand binding domain-containing protein [Candidatus Methanomethyliaceae archaeon]
MANVIALMLLITETGKEYDIVKEVKKLHGVSECRVVYGEYDVFIRMEAADLPLLDEIVTKIRGIAGVVQTTTLVAPP